MISELFIFIVGVVITLATLIAVGSVGLAEASDPAHSRRQDLTDVERRLVDREEVDREAIGEENRNTVEGGKGSQ